MNKQDLIDAMANSADISKAEAENALNAFIDSTIDTVAGGGKVTIPGFVVIESSERNARTGRNPQTGAELQIPAMTVPKFKAGKKFKEAVNK